MSGNIIKAEPASYPYTNTAEINAVTVLTHILDKSRVKPFLNTLDKVPNVDGYFEIVNEKQQPVGKIEVQIKFLPEKKTVKPKHQCDVAFLAYCEGSILPVLLIVVEPTAEKAFWIHLNRKNLAVISKRIKGHTVNVDIPFENIIEKNQNLYITFWEEILAEYKTRHINYDSVKEELDTVRASEKKLKMIANPALGIERDCFREIHYFLDYYNHLLENDFEIIKEIFFKDCWKIGLAYSAYSDYHLSYSLFSILYNANDIQIKEIQQNHSYQLENALNYRSHNAANPIRHSPEQYAYEHIIENLKKIVDGKMLLPVNEFVANEYIVSFVDCYEELTGFDKGTESYKLTDILYAIDVYMPLICSEYFQSENQTEESSFDLEHFRWHVFAEEIEELNRNVTKKLKENKDLKSAVRIFSSDFNLKYLRELIKYLENLNELSVKRLYPKQRWWPEKRFIWESYDKEQIKSIMHTIFKSLPKVYDEFAAEYFPNIKDHISFFSQFDMLIINLEVKEEVAEARNAPGIEMIYLKKLGHKAEPQINLYLNGKNMPFVLRDAYLNLDRTVTIENEKYKVLNSSSSFLDNIFHAVPMQDYIYDTLKNRLENYLHSFKAGSSSIFKFTRY